MPVVDVVVVDDAVVVDVSVAVEVDVHVPHNAGQPLCSCRATIEFSHRLARTPHNPGGSNLPLHTVIVAVVVVVCPHESHSTGHTERALSLYIGSLQISGMDDETMAQSDGSGCPPQLAIVVIVVVVDIVSVTEVVVDVVAVLVSVVVVPVVPVTVVPVYVVVVAVFVIVVVVVVADVAVFVVEEIVVYVPGRSSHKPHITGQNSFRVCLIEIVDALHSGFKLNVHTSEGSGLL